MGILRHEILWIRYIFSKELNRISRSDPGRVGADGRTRTVTGYPTTPSRWRVYQFHHIGIVRGSVPGIGIM